MTEEQCYGIADVPTPIWRWYVFGKSDPYDLLIVETSFNVPWWRRFVTRIILGSVWERL